MSPVARRYCSGSYRSDIGYAVKNPARVELTVDHQTGIAS